MSVSTTLLDTATAQSTNTVGSSKLDSFDQIYIFGDSLSDPGNLFSITEGTIPANPAYPEQRFSNGLVWSEYFTPKFRLYPSPFTQTLCSADGINFAVAGATTGEINVNGATLPSLQQQLNEFITLLYSTHQRANSQALYILWAGANDYLGGQITNPMHPVCNLSQAIESLYQVGARHFLIFNLPELGDTPLGNRNEAASRDQLNQLSQAHNRLLERITAQLRLSHRDLQITVVDIWQLFKTVMAVPYQFGLTNVTEGCLIVASSDSDRYLFWDELHPTTTAHQIIAEVAFSTLQLQSQPLQGLTLI